jgi:hypothetical protein
MNELPGAMLIEVGRAVNDWFENWIAAILNVSVPVLVNNNVVSKNCPTLTLPKSMEGVFRVRIGCPIPLVTPSRKINETRVMVFLDILTRSSNRKVS